METNKNDYIYVSIEDTKKYGIVCAAIIGRVRTWCKHNEEKKVKDRFHDGEWWSGFMNYNEFALQIGISVKTIEKHLPKLIKSEILIKGNFNKRKNDRTGWYRVNPTPPNIGDTYPQIEGMDTPNQRVTIPPNRGNGYPQNGGTFTYKSSVSQSVKPPVIPPVSPAVEQNTNLKKVLLQGKICQGLNLRTEQLPVLIENNFSTYQNKELLEQYSSTIDEYLALK